MSVQAVPEFPVPSFSDLLSQIAADFTALPGADVTLRMGVIPVMKLVLAKMAAAEYLYVAAFPNRCLIPTLMKKPYIDVFCGTRLPREAATPATGSVQFAGTNGITLPTGAQMQDTTGTLLFQTTESVVVTGGYATATVTQVFNATSTSGSAGNLATGAPVTLLVGVAGIVATGVVLAPGLTGGTDEETDADYQERLGELLANPPQGGADSDYVAWAKRVAGVTRVWVYPATPQPGYVAVTFAMDGRTNPIPLSADVTNVTNAILAVCGNIVTLGVFAPTAVNTPVTIAGLTAAAGFTLSQAQAAAAAAVAGLNYVTTPGGTGWDSTQSATVEGGTYKYEQIVAAIANAAGVGTFDLTAPATDVTAGYGQIIQFEAPTFT